MAPDESADDIIETAKKRLKIAEDEEQEIRKDGRDDLLFCAGEQWKSADKQSREFGTGGATANRPCLTINKLIGPLNQTANEARMNQAGIEVSPVDSLTDPDTAEVVEGMIRHIEQVSKADEVYETAIEQAASCGFGYFKVTFRYCGAKSFDKELRIERFPDPFSVYIDPYAKEADKSDMGWAFEFDLIPKEDYRNLYPDSEITSFNFYEGGQNPVPDWIKDTGVRVATYWTVETVTRTLSLVEWPDGQRTGVYKDDLPDNAEGLRPALDDNGKPIERETKERKVHCYKINGVEILDEYDWPGQWIPILVVLGKEMWVDAKRKIFSLVRFAKDPQRLYNFYRSSEAETVLCGTKTPWIGAKGIFKDPRWASANVLNYATLEYEPLDIAGNPAQPPIRNTFEPPIQALSLGAAQAADDIKATTNVYDASLGAPGPEVSGVAIRQRQSQTGLSNAHFIDNLNRAIRQCGVILTDMIPKIYDTARQVRILGEDQAQKIVMVNAPFRDWPAPLRQQSPGITDPNKCYALASGQYDVTISVGPSYSTQRQETWATLTQLATAYPQIVQIAGDIMFQNADFPGAQQLADRLRKTLPPALQDNPSSPQQQAQMLGAQVQQQAQTIQQLTQALTNANEQIRTRAIEEAGRLRAETIKYASDDRQTALKAQVDLITGLAKVTPDGGPILLMQIQKAEQMINAMSTGAVIPSAAPPVVAPPVGPQPPLAAPAGSAFPAAPPM